MKGEDDRGLRTVCQNQHDDGDVVETEVLICRAIIYDAQGPKGHWTLADSDYEREGIRSLARESSERK